MFKYFCLFFLNKQCHYSWHTKAGCCIIRVCVYVSALPVQCRRGYTVGVGSSCGPYRVYSAVCFYREHLNGQLPLSWHSSCKCWLRFVMALDRSVGICTTSHLACSEAELHTYKKSLAVCSNIPFYSVLHCTLQ